MKNSLLISLIVFALGINTHAQELKTYENKAFKIDYPADWEVTWDGESFVNIANEDGDIKFDVSFNQQGPTKAQLQNAVDNWVYMKESHGNKVDQKLVKDDYALVRSIITDEDDGKKTVEVWFIMISLEPEGFSGTMTSPIEHANEALDILVKMLATLSPR